VIDIIQNKSVIATYNSSIISKLKKLADKSLNKRSRAIIHLTRDSKVNEMIIVLKKGSYIRPHSHPNKKTESYHLIEGKMSVCIFNKNGKVIKIVKMGNVKSGLDFYYRMNKSTFHMPIAKSKYCVYHEIYSGPFVKEKDVNYSKWSPLESEKEKVKNFLKEIELNNS
jgi:cupin fold WbuC family metalloprotein